MIVLLSFRHPHIPWPACECSCGCRFARCDCVIFYRIPTHVAVNMLQHSAASQAAVFGGARGIAFPAPAVRIQEAVEDLPRTYVDQFGAVSVLPEGVDAPATSGAYENIDGHR